MTTPDAPARPGRERWIAWHPLLFAAYPVLFLWSQNLGETTPRDVLSVLLLVVAVVLIPFVVLSLLFRDARRAALIVTPIVFGILMYGHVVNLARPAHIRVAFQVAGWALLVGLGLLAALRLGEARLRRANGILDAASVILVVVALVTIVPFEVSAASATAPAPAGGAQVQASGGTPRGPLRDVYYLILDRYGSDAATKLRFGVDNDLTPWLTDHGFRVLPDSHANYVKTSLSIASTLNMTHLDALAARMGTDSSNHEPVFSMLQDSPVARQFKALGYRYLHIGSWFGPTRSDEAADRSLYLGGPSDFAATLYDTSAVSRFARAVGLSHGRSKFERHYQNGQFGWQALSSVRDERGPKFVFAHILLPHPPYVFDRDGNFVDPKKDPSVSEHDRLAGQLTWTNTQLESWIESVQALPADQRPIIIVQADEGPYPTAYREDTNHFDWSTATPNQLEEKYGILNAWYLPDGTDPGLYDSMTSVNTFPVLFSGYFGLNVPRLPDRSYTSARMSRPYDLTDITDRLPQTTP